jgi:hypothetical protein
MNKLKIKAQKSKLQKVKENSLEKIIQFSQKSKHPRSYRFDVETINLLKELVQVINLSSKRKVSETELLQGLVKLGKVIGKEELLKILRERSY